MTTRIRSLRPVLTTFLLAALLMSGSFACYAQSSGVDLSLHANSHTNAAEIGLPAYPGATLYKDADNDSAVDLGFSFGDFHFTVKAANYLTGDSAAQVFAFYRKPLSRYGEVLECSHGKPVGALTITHSGLTCSDQHGGNVQVDSSTNSSSDHELRAGTPKQYRIVGIDETRTGSTRFGLVYLELPKDSAADAKSK
jgi:hypothetical protein